MLGLAQEEPNQRDTGERNDASLDLDPTPWFRRRAPKGSVEEECSEDESVDRTTVENEATGMVVDLESGRADGGEGREVNHEPTVPGLHLVPDQSSCWSQTRGDLEVEYWRERERYLNDLEYDSDAWDRPVRER